MNTIFISYGNQQFFSKVFSWSCFAEKEPDFIKSLLSNSLKHAFWNDNRESDFSLTTGMFWEEKTFKSREMNKIFSGDFHNKYATDQSFNLLS